MRSVSYLAGPVGRTALLAVLLSAFSVRAFAQTDPLPSWNEGTTKKSIVNMMQDWKKVFAFEL